MFMFVTYFLLDLSVCVCKWVCVCFLHMCSGMHTLF